MYSLTLVLLYEKYIIKHMYDYFTRRIFQNSYYLAQLLGILLNK